MSIDKVFLDSSILFSVAQAKSGLNELRKLAKDGQCLIFASQYVIEKAKRNLRHLSHLKTLEKCLSNVQVVLEADKRMPCPIDLPEKARAVLMAAVSARANYLLTGDNEYFGKYLGLRINGVRICTPRDYFLKRKGAN